jgi:hypothetical protein
MSRKNYTKMAAMFKLGFATAKKQSNIEGEACIMALLNAYMETALEDNPRFDKKKFLKACGK